MDDTQRIALVETSTIENGNTVNTPVPVQRYQLSNHLGSASLELDRNGALISYEEYHPYGTTSFQVMTSAAEVSLKRYRYTGRERDEETGFSYHGARYYAPWLGRWLACDPIGIDDGLCLYSYAKSNPLKFTDPMGTTVTVQPNTIHDSINNADISTTQAQANEAFLRDIRAGLADKEASLFQIDKNNRLVFSGNTSSLSQYSEYTQMLVGQINSDRKIVVLPALLGLAKTKAQTDSIVNGNFSVSTQGNTIKGLVLQTSVGGMGTSVLGSVAHDEQGTIFMTYVTSTTAVSNRLPRGVKPGTKLPPVAGMPPNISTAQQNYFKQGNITQTLVHELAAHVEGQLRGEPNQDAHFSRSVPLPGGKSTTLRNYANDTGGDPDPNLVLPNTSKTPFERSLRLEREALANLKAKLPSGFNLGGQPDRRKADVDLIDRAEKNLLKQDFPGLFTGAPGSGYFLQKPIRLGQ
jgi:RHS repeat-associated protein